MLKRIILCSLPLALSLPIVSLAADGLAFARPRPLMELCGELRQKYGLLVTYEDAPFDPASELDSEIIPRNGIKALTPKWKPITFHLAPDLPTLAERSASQAGNAATDPRETLVAVQDLVDQYNQSGNPGRFSVTQDGPYLHIQQTTRMVGGQMQSFDPISDTLLLWQPKSENCYAILGDLSGALGQARGFGVAEGNVPMGQLLMHHCDIGSNSLTVTQVLEAVITGLTADIATGKKISPSSYARTWDLVYDPNWDKYFLSLTSVQTNTQPAPAAVQAAQPVAVTAKPASRQAPTRLAGPRTAKPRN